MITRLVLLAETLEGTSPCWLWLAVALFLLFVFSLYSSAKGCERSDRSTDEQNQSPVFGDGVSIKCPNCGHPATLQNYDHGSAIDYIYCENCNQQQQG